MDERERDKFYSPPDPTGDDEDYELEPLDPAIASAEKRHAEQVAEQVRASINIDEVYREADRSRGTEIIENWARNFHYRFHIKHVLFATAAVVIAIAAAKLGYLVPAVMILIIGSIAGLYFYLSWEERKQQAEADAKREELFAKRREQMQSIGKVPAGVEPQRSNEPDTSAAMPPEPAADMWTEAPEPEPFRIRFSVRSLLIAMTVAAVSLGLISVLGSGPMATVLGLIAFAGLVVHAIGFDPPQPVIFGWWFILLLYVLLTIAGAV
jgi:hypothetical protein